MDLNKKFRDTVRTIRGFTRERLNQALQKKNLAPNPAATLRDEQNRLLLHMRKTLRDQGYLLPGVQDQVITETFRAKINEIRYLKKDQFTQLAQRHGYQPETPNVKLEKLKFINYLREKYQREGYDVVGDNVPNITDLLNGIEIEVVPTTDNLSEAFIRNNIMPRLKHNKQYNITAYTNWTRKWEFDNSNGPLTQRLIDTYLNTIRRYAEAPSYRFRI
jgi:hypothetical protein